MGYRTVHQLNIVNDLVRARCAVEVRLPEFVAGALLQQRECSLARPLQPQPMCAARWYRGCSKPANDDRDLG